MRQEILTMSDFPVGLPCRLYLTVIVIVLLFNALIADCNRLTEEVIFFKIILKNIIVTFLQGINNKIERTNY